MPIYFPYDTGNEHAARGDYTRPHLCVERKGEYANDAVKAELESPF